ncbi:MAG TPA: hypothetical protein VMN38_06925 [Sphingomicrobium sp.]|nr:hypothetical protein [Sphingomicrobium sp.]
MLRTGAAASLGVSDPLRATQIAPGNARAAVAAVRARVEAGDNVASPALRSQVRAALLRDVTLPAAIELCAVQLEATGNARRASRLFELSSAISRRSLPTRLWLIQRSVDHGDVAGALANFDLALRTSSAAPEVLFPVLASAATDPQLVRPIARLLDRPSDWRAMFLSYAIHEGGEAAAMAEVVLRMRDRGAVTAAKADQMLIGQLVKQGAFAVAHRIHAAFGRAGSRAALVIDPDFDDAESRYPFGWGLTDAAQTGAARGRVGGSAALVYRAVPGAAGQVATQLLMLKPGAYRLVTASAAPPSADAPFWTVTCASRGGAQIALLSLPAETRVVAGADFTVPAGCDGQWLGFNLRASDRPGGQAGAVRSVSVQRR